MSCLRTACESWCRGREKGFNSEDDHREVSLSPYLQNLLQQNISWYIFLSEKTVRAKKFFNLCGSHLGSYFIFIVSGGSAGAVSCVLYAGLELVRGLEALTPPMSLDLSFLPRVDLQVWELRVCF